MVQTEGTVRQRYLSHNVGSPTDFKTGKIRSTPQKSRKGGRSEGIGESTKKSIKKGMSIPKWISAKVKDICCTTELHGIQGSEELGEEERGSEDARRGTRRRKDKEGGNGGVSKGAE